MKKIILILSTLLTACVSHEIKPVKHNEVGLNDKFANRIFNISCEGDDYSGKNKVEEKCKEFASKFAFDKGYLYFSVLDHNNSSNVKIGSYTTYTPVTSYSSYGYGSSTSYIPQTNISTDTIYNKTYMFVMIGENELNDWNNYYKVLDYYTPPQETN